MRRWTTVFVALVLPLSAAGEVCTDYTGYFRWVGGAPGSGGLDVRAANGLLFTAAGSALNIYDPEGSVPLLVGSVPLGSDALALDVDGDLAYVETTAGLYVVDISQPSAASVLGSCAHGAGGAESDVEAAGKYAYVAHGSIAVVDASAPASPVVVGYVATPGWVYDLEIKGTLGCASIYQLGPGGSLQILDFSNPSQPVVVGSLPMPDYCFGIALGDNGLAYVACRDSLYAVDVSVPNDPQVVASAFVNLGELAGVDYADGYAYVCSETGLRVFDVSNPAQPIATARFNPGGPYIQEVDVSNELAIVVPNLSIFDLNSRVGAGVLGEITLPPGSSAGSVAATEGRAFVGNGLGGFSIVDISSPEEPSFMAHVTAADAGGQMAAFGGYLYVSGGAGLRVFDVSKPVTPVELALVEIPGGGAISYASGIVYLAAPSYLWVINVSYPPAPAVLGSYHGPVPGGQQQGVEVRGEWAYVASGSRGLDLINVGRPQAPLYERSVDTPGFAHAVQVKGEYAYVADGSQGGLQIIDLDTPLGPAIVAAVPLPGDCYDVAVIGSTAYAAVGYPGVIIVDVSDPTAPAAIGCVSTRVRSFYVAANRDVVCGSDFQGLVTLAHECGTTTSTPHLTAGETASLLPAPYPNPFSASLNIRLELPGICRSRVTVFDVAGREIVRIVDGTLIAGRHLLSWDGSDTTGRRVAAGVYLVRLESSQSSQTRRVVVTR